MRWAAASSTIVRSAAVASVGIAVHTALNARLLRVAPPASTITELVSVILPVRDEAARLGPCLDALLAVTHLPRLEIIAYDDESTDGTDRLLAAWARDDPRVTVVRGGPPPSGWLGKPHACAQAAAVAAGSVLVFLDADVTLAPQGIARAILLLRASGLDLISPYPRQEASGLAERLIQPLLSWLWLALLPLRLAERSPRPSLSAAGGQFLCVDAAAYRRAGGHAAVHDQIIEDVALLRAVKRAGGRGVVVDGTDLASNRMYDGWPSLRDGYAKSLAAAGGSPAASAAQIGLLSWLYVLPAIAALRGRPAAVVGCLAGVASRTIAAHRTSGRRWPDPLTHPASISLLGYLTALSWWRRRSGRATWKGRRVTFPSPAGGVDRGAPTVRGHDAAGS
ncbi:4,4'-diaponeurosporenoate glycosyltransferase [Frankia sp. AiPs1]|uniref:glycosyltransferase n=1 Tax=Frankia sp. AiPa1 TaxID=573492 RepID=UPI00202AEF47|nr:glycosyltransferase family A protein [Frankia sp. AiPa1]MCL9757981.1 glycosyltransferase family 2 protein [Frankia sp. AiPa1]